MSVTKEIAEKHFNNNTFRLKNVDRKKIYFDYVMDEDNKTNPWRVDVTNSKHGTMYNNIGQIMGFVDFDRIDDAISMIDGIYESRVLAEVNNDFGSYILWKTE